jgi:hypothetical protein
MSDAASFPSPAMKIVILASVLVLSLVATFFGYTKAEETRQKIAAFAADSTDTTGIVTNWEITNVSRSPEYWLDVTFHAQDGTTRNVSANVQEGLFHHARIGSSVPVTYVRSRPEWFYLADEVPTDRQAVALDWLFRLGAGASVLTAIGLLFRFFRDGTGGASAGSAPAGDAPSVLSRPASPPVRRAPRPGGFGKRQTG